MRNLYLILILVFISIICLKCGGNIESTEDQKNISELEIEFGRLLFEDKRLSINNTVSCKSCHIPELAFTDGKTLSDGVNGRKSFRNAPSLLNVRDFKKFMADAEVSSLEMQVLAPIQDHNEMGSSVKIVLDKLKNDQKYQEYSQKVYNRVLDAFVITRALSAFERTLISKNSKFDEFVKNNYSGILTDDELAGWKLFSGRLNCIKCHKLPNFSNNEARNNGITNDSIDFGRYRITGREEDKSSFKVPSLRNVEITAPYLHNGSIKTLEELIVLYGAKKSEYADSLVKSIKISSREQHQLISFLRTLTEKSSR